MGTFAPKTSKQTNKETSKHAVKRKKIGTQIYKVGYKHWTYDFGTVRL